MPPSTIDTKIQARIESFAHELSELVKQAAVESVQEALNGSGPTRRGRKPRAKAVAKRGSSRSSRRSSEQVADLGKTILAHVKSNQGHRLEEISAALKTPSKELKRPVALLLEAKKLKKRGQKRGTKYFAGAAGATKTKAKRKTSKRKATRR